MTSPTVNLMNRTATSSGLVDQLESFIGAGSSSTLIGQNLANTWTFLASIVVRWRIPLERRHSVALDASRVVLRRMPLTLAKQEPLLVKWLVEQAQIRSALQVVRQRCACRGQAVLPAVVRSDCKAIQLKTW